MKTSPLVLLAVLVLSSAAAAHGVVQPSVATAAAVPQLVCPRNAICMPIATPRPLPPPPIVCPPFAMCVPFPGKH
jgi:hypothetical protein